MRVDHEFDRSLSTLIESEIIPRLMVAHSTDIPAIACTMGSCQIETGEVESLAPLALQVEADALLAHIETIMARAAWRSTR